MPARNHAEPWVLAMRDTLKAEVGPAYRVGDHKGKARLDIRFSDGTRQVGTLGIPWLAANAKTIRERVEKLAGLIGGGHTLKSALEQLQGSVQPAPVSTNSTPSDLMAAWVAFGEDKVGRNEIVENTWRVGYKSAGDRLKKVGDAPNAVELLERVARAWQPGSRQRVTVVRQIRAMLAWATGPDGKYRLSPERWTPPPLGSLKRFYGQKSGQLKAKTAEPTVPFTDEQILALLDAMPTESAHPRDRQAAKQWKFAFQLMATYGLRPVEIHYLELKTKPKRTLHCNWIKRTGGGTGKPRRLFPWHPEWEEEWNLLQRLADGEPLPPMTNRGVAQRGMEYLKRMKVFQPMHDEGCTMKSFRHAYSYRCHQTYGLSGPDAAAYMGHSVDVHNNSYSQWFSEKHLEDSAAQALRYREMVKARG